MDAARLAFPGERFDAVYAPYVINVVPDPLGVTREMLRVCRPGGRLVFLNHFAARRKRPVIGRLVGGIASRATGVDWDLDLDDVLRQAGLNLMSIEPVNLHISSVVLCRKS
jgi:phosphatidylethanolamine/phosphatidyl-N-methylethanolamine N-methyltransferase